MAAPSASVAPRMSIGDYEIGDEIDRPKRGYTTRAKEEARRTEVKFVGDVRRWEKRWTNVGHLRVAKWVRIESDKLGVRAEATAALLAQPVENAYAGGLSPSPTRHVLSGQYPIKTAALELHDVAGCAVTDDLDVKENEE